MRALLMAACVSLAALTQAEPAAIAQEIAPLEKLTLDQAVERALANNPSLTIAIEEVRRTRALLEQVRAASLPTLYANGQYTRLDNDRTLANADGTQRVISGANQISANLTLLVPLLAPMQWAAWAHASDSVDVSKVNGDEVRRQIALATARAYLAVLSQKRVVQVSMSAVDTDRAHHEFAHQRWKGGVGNRLDEVRAASVLATDTSSLATARTILVRLREQLGILCGGDAPLDTVDEPGIAEPPALDAALHDVESVRSDVRAARAKELAAKHLVRDNYTDYLPILNGSFQPFYQNPPTLTQPTLGWQAFLVLQLPLYDGGARYGRGHERRSLHRQAQAQTTAVLRTARAEVRIAFFAMRQADEALTSSRDAARLAHEALDMSMIAYRAGATTNLEVTDAERRARDADIAATVAEDAARQARLDLLASSGHFP